MASKAGQTTLDGAGTQSHSRRVKDFLELHEQVQTSVGLLDSLESFLSTFQKDLSAVSSQISELQDRSKDIENRLGSRGRIERSLSSLLSDITISPALATLILDTPVGEPWIEAIQDFERRLETIKARARVKAARDLAEVAEGLRIVAATKLRAFFLALFQPIRSNVTTNMQVIQTSVLLKYSEIFAFLQRQATNAAHEVQRSYIGAARVYYETGFRRYIRSLNLIKARAVEKHESIVSMQRDLQAEPERFSHAAIHGPGVTLAFMADDKSHKEPIESLLRSLLLVFMDNATAEYIFLKSFFFSEEAKTPVPTPLEILSPCGVTLAESRSVTESESGGRDRSATITPTTAMIPSMSTKKEEQVNADVIWKQIMDPVLTYCETFFKSVLEPQPAVISLLTMIRLTEDVIVEVQKRNCPPIEFFVFSLRLQLWPIFQKGMADHVEALKKLAEGSSFSYFSRAAATTDAGVLSMCKRYTTLFNSFIALTEQEEETMIFSNLLRLRQELTKLVVKHTGSIVDVAERARAQSKNYQLLLQGLNQGIQRAAHPKAQQEIAYWGNLNEEAKRKQSVRRINDRG